MTDFIGLALTISLGSVLITILVGIRLRHQFIKSRVRLRIPCGEERADEPVDKRIDERQKNGYPTKAMLASSVLLLLLRLILTVSRLSELYVISSLGAGPTTSRKQTINQCARVRQSCFDSSAYKTKVPHLPHVDDDSNPHQQIHALFAGILTKNIYKQNKFEHEHPVQLETKYELSRFTDLSIRIDGETRKANVDAVRKLSPSSHLSLRFKLILLLALLLLRL